MKRFGYTIVCLVLVLGLAAGCAPQGNESGMKEGKVNVVTSFFPLYDFAATIGGDYVHVINMIPTGVEPHEWTPKSQDMTNISKAQMFVYQGSGFEGWTEDVLGGIDTSGIVIVEASNGIPLMKAAETDTHADEGAHEEEAAHADEEAHEEEKADHADEHEHGEYDPHTWLSPRSAIYMAENILDGLKKADPEHAAEYTANFESLKKDLTALDQKFTEQLSAVSNKEMVVSHQAFGYLARDYGLVQMPMMGISPDGEPTAQDLKKISEFVKEHNVTYLFTEELVSDQLAKTLADDLGIQTLPLHPLEGLTEAEAQANETYITVMEKNLANLVTALQ
jgi:zinc transport system substrate-binding protein